MYGNTTGGATAKPLHNICNVFSSGVEKNVFKSDIYTVTQVQGKATKANIKKNVTI